MGVPLQEYVLPDVRDREFLMHFHKKARKVGLDVAEYNRLKDSVAQLERDLQRLRDPLRVHHPPSSSSSGDLNQQDRHQAHHAITASLWDRTQYRLQKFIRQASQQDESRKS